MNHLTLILVSTSRECPSSFNFSVSSNTEHERRKLQTNSLLQRIGFVIFLWVKLLNDERHLHVYASGLRLP